MRFPILFSMATLALALLSGCEKPAPGSSPTSAAGISPSPPPTVSAPQPAEASLPPASAGIVSEPAVSPPAGKSGLLNVLLWNLESGASDPALIAGQLGEYANVDLFVCSEVLPSEMGRFLDAVRKREGAEYSSVNGTTGGDDSLQVIYNTRRLELLASDQPQELSGRRVNDGRHRSPILCHFRDIPSGQTFHLVTVHLARGNAGFRTEQSIAIREWARDQLEPVVLAGDLNYDFVFETEKGNEAFAELQRDNVLQWIRPVELIDSNWFDGNRDGVDDYPGSLLDGAYVSGPAKNWNACCTVLVREGDFPDDERTSDHRALRLELEIR